MFINVFNCLSTGVLVSQFQESRINDMLTYCLLEEDCGDEASCTDGDSGDDEGESGSGGDDEGESGDDIPDIDEGDGFDEEDVIEEGDEAIPIGPSISK